MSGADRFAAPGSPLDGRRVPRDWGRLDGPAKRRALVACGYAESYEAACRLMGRHAAAVVRARRMRMERMEEGRRAAARRTGEMLEAEVRVEKGQTGEGVSA